MLQDAHTAASSPAQACSTTEAIRHLRATMRLAALGMCALLVTLGDSQSPLMTIAFHSKDALYVLWCRIYPYPVFVHGHCEVSVLNIKYIQRVRAASATPSFLLNSAFSRTYAPVLTHHSVSDQCVQRAGSAPHAIALAVLQQSLLVCLPKSKIVQPVH